MPLLQTTSVYEPALDLKRDFAAKGDVKTISDAAINASSNQLSSTNAAFVAADAGKYVQVAGAGTTATFTATTVNASTFLTTVSSTASIVPGQTISGTGIPTGTTVVGIVVANSKIQISQAATAGNAGVTMTVGNPISGTITSVSGGVATISVTATTSVTGATMTFGSNDTSAFVNFVNQLLASFNARGDGYVPGGDYYIDWSQVPSLAAWHGKLFGADRGALGFGTTLVNLPGVSSGDLLTIGKLATISDLGIDGNHTVCSGTGRAIVVTDAYANLSNLFIAGAPGDGIAYTTSASVGGQLKDVIVRACQGYGLNIAALAFDNDFHSLNIGNCGKSGVDLKAADSAFSLLHSWGNGTLGTSNDQNGVNIRNGIGACRFAIPYLENNYSRGMYAPNSGATGTNISGGFVWQNQTQGMYLFGASSWTVTGATIYDNGQFGSAGHNSVGIELDTCTDMSVTGNTFYDDQATKTQTNPVFESNACANNTITGNNMRASRHKTGGAVITSTTNTPLQLFVGSTHTTTTIDGITSTAGLIPGMTISGTGIPAAAVIATIVSATSITISAAATSTNAGITLTTNALSYFNQT